MAASRVFRVPADARAWMILETTVIQPMGVPIVAASVWQICRAMGHVITRLEGTREKALGKGFGNALSIFLSI